MVSIHSIHSLDVVRTILYIAVRLFFAKLQSIIFFIEQSEVEWNQMFLDTLYESRVFALNLMFLKLKFHYWTLRIEKNRLSFNMIKSQRLFVEPPVASYNTQQKLFFSRLACTITLFKLLFNMILMVYTVYITFL